MEPLARISLLDIARFNLSAFHARHTSERPNSRADHRRLTDSPKRDQLRASVQWPIGVRTFAVSLLNVNSNLTLA